MRRTCWRNASRRSPGVAQVQVYGQQKYAVRIQLDPNRLAAMGLGIDEVASAVQTGNVNSADRHAQRTAPRVRRRSGRATLGCFGVSRSHRRVSQWRAGPSGFAGERRRCDGERQVGRVGRARPEARHRARDLPPAWLERGGTGGLGTRRAADAAPAAAAGARSPDPLRPRADDSCLGLRRAPHARHLDRARRAGDLPVPALGARGVHSERRHPDVARRHVRGDVPQRLQRRQPVAHGADTVDRLRRGRRHRDARERLASRRSAAWRRWRPRAAARRKSASRSSR